MYRILHSTMTLETISQSEKLIAFAKEYGVKGIEINPYEATPNLYDSFLIKKLKDMQQKWRKI